MTKHTILQYNNAFGVTNKRQNVETVILWRHSHQSYAASFVNVPRACGRQDAIMNVYIQVINFITATNIELNQNRILTACFHLPFFHFFIVVWKRCFQSSVCRMSILKFVFSFPVFCFICSPNFNGSFTWTKIESFLLLYMAQCIFFSYFINN